MVYFEIFSKKLKASGKPQNRLEDQEHKDAKHSHTLKLEQLLISLMSGVRLLSNRLRVKTDKNSFVTCANAYL